ncbi:hypothetical protein ACROYT_G015025 [Oculina patagonica]
MKRKVHIYQPYTQTRGWSYTDPQVYGMQAAPQSTLLGVNLALLYRSTQFQRARWRIWHQGWEEDENADENALVKHLKMKTKEQVLEKAARVKLLKLEIGIDWLAQFKRKIQVLEREKTLETTEGTLTCLRRYLNRPSTAFNHFEALDLLQALVRLARTQAHTKADVYAAVLDECINEIHERSHRLDRQAHQPLGAKNDDSNAEKKKNVEPLDIIAIAGQRNLKSLDSYYSTLTEQQKNMSLKLSNYIQTREAPKKSLVENQFKTPKVIPQQNEVGGCF